MRAPFNPSRFVLTTALACLMAPYCMGQTPTNAAAAAGSVTMQPSAPVASQPANAAPSRSADTIGELADRQRMKRMLESQGKPNPVAQAAQPVVGGINIEKLPQANQAVQKPKRPDMLLLETMIGPKAAQASIEVNGVERRVAIGDDLGNGWRVKVVHRFTVILEEVTNTSKQVDQSKGKGKKQPASKPNLKTRTLEIRSPSIDNVDSQAQAIQLVR